VLGVVKPRDIEFAVKVRRERIWLCLVHSDLCITLSFCGRYVINRIFRVCVGSSSDLLCDYPGVVIYGFCDQS